MIDVIAMSSGFLIGEAILQEFLILGNERGMRMLSLSLSAHDPERSSRLQRNIGIGSVAAFFWLFPPRQRLSRAQAIERPSIRVDAGKLKREGHPNEAVIPPALCNALRVLLPAYRGRSVRLFRGAGAYERRHRISGLCWSADRAGADRFARERQVMDGGSVLLETIAPDAAPAMRHYARPRV